MYPFLDYWVFGREYYGFNISSIDLSDLDMQAAMAAVVTLTGWPLQDPEFSAALHDFYWDLAEEEFGQDIQMHKREAEIDEFGWEDEESNIVSQFYIDGVWREQIHGYPWERDIEIPDAVDMGRQPAPDDMWMFNAWPDVCYEDATEALQMERDSLRFKVRDRRVQSFSRAGRVKRWTFDCRRNTSDWNGKKTRPFMRWSKQMKNAVRFDQMQEDRLKGYLGEYCKYFCVEKIRNTRGLGGYYHGTDEQRAEQKRLRHARKEVRSNRRHVGMPKGAQDMPERPGFSSRKMKRSPSLRRKWLPYDRKAGRLRERTTQAILDRALELHQLGHRRVVTIHTTWRPHRPAYSSKLIWPKGKQTIKISGVIGMKKEGFNGIFGTVVLCLETKKFIKINSAEKDIYQEPRKGSPRYIWNKKFSWLA